MSNQKATPERTKITTRTFHEKRQSGEPITMLTAYDYGTALAVDRAGIDSILVKLILSRANTSRTLNRVPALCSVEKTREHLFPGALLSFLERTRYRVRLRSMSPMLSFMISNP